MSLYLINPNIEISNNGHGKIYCDHKHHTKHKFINKRSFAFCGQVANKSDHNQQYKYSHFQNVVLKSLISDYFVKRCPKR